MQSPGKTPREIISDIWTSIGGEASALDALTLTGDEPQLPSSFRVAAAAQVSVAATGLAAAGIWKMRSGEAQDVAWGSQIRSYVMQPYTMVKDHRTNTEVGDINRVLDGDLDPFVRAELMRRAGKSGNGSQN